MNATTTVLQTDSLLFRPTLPDDLERICTIIRQAQAQMRLRGSRQWQNGYPAAAHITDDIDRGYGHVLCTHTGLVVAYGAVVFDGEPAYAEIDGTWLDQAPYVVLHRLAVAQEVKGQGIATEFMRRTMTLARERGTGSFRIDTNFDNRCMLRLLAKIRLRPLRRNTLRRRSSHRIPENPLTGTSCPAKRRTGRFLPQISGCFQTPENADGRSIRPYLFVPLPPL